MANREYQFNRYGERDVRPGHFQHQGGQGSLYKGHSSASKLSLTGFQDDLGMNRDEEPLTWSHDPRSEAASEHHTGKGPRGWKYSDEKIKEDVCEALFHDWEVDASAIEVSVQEGIVTLRGEVPNRKQKKLAEFAVEDIKGVIDVMNELTLKVMN